MSQVEPWTRLTTNHDHLPYPLPLFMMSTTEVESEDGRSSTLVGKSHIVELIEFVFREVWGEFYSWNEHYCQSSLAALYRDSTEGESNGNPLSAPSVGNKKHLTRSKVPATFVCDSEDAFVLETFSEDSTTSLRPTISETVYAPLIFAPAMSPTPEYESVAPSLRSIFIGDDPDAMAFMPFGEEANFGGFDTEDYASQHETLAWEKRYGRDPDCECL